MKSRPQEVARWTQVDLPTFSWTALQKGLRDDIWEKLILEARNFVFEAELALFQARKPELIPFNGRFQRDDGFVEISMLLPELRKLMAEAYVV